MTKLYGRAIELQPEDGHSKYMYMGQITVGHESVKYFLAGIELMKKSLASSTSEQVMVLSVVSYHVLYLNHICTLRRSFVT